MIKKNIITLSKAFLILFCILILIYYLPLTADAYSSNDAIDLSYWVNKTKTKPGESIEITMKLVNNTNYQIRGFYFSDHLPTDLIPQTTLVSIDGNSIEQTSYTVNVTSEEIYDGTMATRWILETPPEFIEARPIPAQGGFVEIIYTVSCPIEGTYNLSTHNWVGSLDNLQKERVFGYNEANIPLKFEKESSSNGHGYNPIFPFYPNTLNMWCPITPYFFGAYLPYQYQLSNYWQPSVQDHIYNYTSPSWQIPTQSFDFYTSSFGDGGYWEIPTQEYNTNYYLSNFWYPSSSEYYYSSLYWQIPNWQIPNWQIPNW